ncbi:hypothetical protein [Candidatus Methylobacter favarea]|uniref:hypothetical protein n=1 Tax=Candidatus Methylobacter favarea TaxID=2707345 RepID=UPI001C2DA309|nr:hypothetical protein [Candidatus Methylobacter favarea]
MHLAGLAQVGPRLTCFYFLFALPGIVMLGTNGFPAELLLLIRDLMAHPGLGIAALAGTILGTAYMLSFRLRVFFGSIKHVRVKQIQDLRSRELTLLCAGIVNFTVRLLSHSVLKLNHKPA